jgi:hypothetical protein
LGRKEALIADLNFSLLDTERMLLDLKSHALQEEDQCDVAKPP